MTEVFESEPMSEWGRTHACIDVGRWRGGYWDIWEECVCVYWRAGVGGFRTEGLCHSFCLICSLGDPTLCRSTLGGVWGWALGCRGECEDLALCWIYQRVHYSVLPYLLPEMSVQMVKCQDGGCRFEAGLRPAIFFSPAYLWTWRCKIPTEKIKQTQLKIINGSKLKVVKLVDYVCQRQLNWLTVIMSKQKKDKGKSAVTGPVFRTDEMTVPTAVEC